MSTNNSPIQRLRRGTISVAIFENTTEEGKKYFNITPQRSYRAGDEWKQTKSFGRDDLLTLAKLLDQADTWITEHLATDPADAVEE